MSEGGPKLYSNKPKKSQLKKTMSSLPTGGPNPPPPPPSAAAGGAATTTASTSGSYSGFPPHKESFARRYKFVWPILLTVNLGIGAYLFVRSGQKKRLVAEDDEVAASAPSSATSTTTAPISEQSVTEPVKPIAQPVKPQTPIPAEQQRELYKWILEEKRKVKPTSAEEKKKLDEEKAVLKAFIRSKTIPSI
ncbi:uncharacterized protein LOC113295358 [Papaver somniferum]|uniref:uncharacterized protein LOC113295358 n=1 Tax=Papaver somniferum TaxID=3469 RepID=UPI000E6FC73D|nr:uncharacterized protein LOC113295358 [Papaver somniferum]